MGNSEITVKIVCYYENGFKGGYWRETDFTGQNRGLSSFESGSESGFENATPQEW